MIHCLKAIALGVFFMVLIPISTATSTPPPTSSVADIRAQQAAQALIIPAWHRSEEDHSELRAARVHPANDIDWVNLTDTRSLNVRVEGTQSWSLLLRNVQGSMVLRSDKKEALQKSEMEGSLLIGTYAAGAYHITFSPETDLSSLEMLWYRWADRDTRSGFGCSLPCHINSVCDTEKVNQRASVCKISMTMEEGIVSCSGSLVRSLGDSSLYVLSAFHCADGLTPIYDDWKFEWYYASDQCEDVMEEPGSLKLTGCSAVSGNQDSDHLLLRLSEDVPAGDSVYASGWDRRCNVFPEDSYMVHHPAGDIQKISYARDSTRLETSPIEWENDVTSPPRSHVRVRLTRGTQEPGSSGSPLYSPEGRVIGQLHGGNSECQFFTTGATYGRLCYGWDDGDEPGLRLDQWLDPMATDTAYIDGVWRQSMTPAISRISGDVVDRIGRPVALVNIRAVDLERGDTLRAISGSDGTWEITEGTQVGASYQVYLSKDTEPKNGISARDIVAIQKHLLRRDTFTDPRLIDASEANSVSTGVSVLDLVILRRLLLSVLDDFRDELDSWILYPSQVTVRDLTADGVHLSASAIKRGDVNDTADPSR